ncbi:MAG: PhnD/SsuA/transferrin family substrate-binding protein, partial [Gammaproteobacteria bacterium]|nr:PhnD/SsuA/transferrin family substrate-binding protein [Gammaproteobacteria bacterium]
MSRRLCVAALGILASLFQSSAQAQDNEIVLGLIPALSAEVMVRRFQPIAMHLSREIGIPVRLEGAPDYETFMNRALEGSNYDMMVTGADFYRLAERRAGYRAMVRVDGPGVQAIIITAKANGHNTLADLPQ